MIAEADSFFNEEYIEKMVQITSGFSKEGYQVILASYCREEGDLDAAREIKNRSEQQKNITIFDYDLSINSRSAILSDSASTSVNFLQLPHDLYGKVCINT